MLFSNLKYTIHFINNIIVMGDILDWTLTKRNLYPHHSLFKIKQISEDAFIVHIPWKKQIEFYDLQMQLLQQNLTFSQSMQAIQFFKIDNTDFGFAGLKNGTIQGKSIITQQNNEEHTIQLKIQSQLGNNIYINDMLYLKQGKLINCYNSGNLALWDVTKIQNNNQPQSYLKDIHEDYIYKIRLVDDNKIVSCGNDGYSNLIDLQTSQIVDFYRHPDSVWCCYPINENLLCSAGLFKSLLFRDIRSGEIAQILQLQSSETSYITQLNTNYLVFGDRKKISRCDMRKLQLQNHCQQYGMKVSAESIIVTPNGGIAVGRGSDMCLFQNGGIQNVPEEKIITQVGHPFSNYYNFINNFLANFQQNQQVQQPIINNQIDDELQFQNEDDQQQYEDEDSDNQLL